MTVRCPWCPASDPLYCAYHDTEWGVPVADDHRLFEKIVLEGAQAGLSWITILRKRARYREVFAEFDPARVARFTPARIEQLLIDPGIVRNRLKVESAVSNARAFLRLQAREGSFARWYWQFLDGRPVQNALRSMGDLPSRTPLSDRISKELKREGFRFVGSTTTYATMQSVGMVNDHIVGCFRYAEIAKLGQSFTPPG